MELKASLNNIRMAPRKVRLVANMIKGMPAAKAKAQLAFLVRKPAPFILKLLNSAVANAKHNFEIPEQNLFIESIVVEAGPTLKRWLPRAQGRATPLHKRTCSVKIVLGELNPSAAKQTKKSKPEAVKSGEVIPVQEEKFEKTENNKEKSKGSSKAFKSGQNEKKKASRQSVGSIKKVFRRKSV